MSKAHNVIAVTFAEESKAYEALSKLQQAGTDDLVRVRGAAIVDRQPDGTIRVEGGDEDDIGVATASGSLIGVLIGVLGGPVGMLIGLSAGMAVGAAVDLDHADEAEGLLDQMSKALPVGTTAIVAEVDESSVDVIDDEMSRLGGTIIRRPADEVLDELEAAEKAAKASQKEARRVMRQERKAERTRKHEQSREHWDERVSALKDRLGHHDETSVR